MIRMGATLQCYERNQALLDKVWSRIERRWRAYPQPLRRLANALVATLGPRPHRYFSGPDAAPILHLPIWLAGSQGFPGLLDLLEATALAYLFVRIEDNVIDEPVTRGKPPQLLLGNLLLTDAITLMASFTNSDRFWKHARAAWMMFSGETEAERIALARRQPYQRAAFRRHARKVALARIPLYAVLARTQKAGGTQVAAVDRLIDHLGEAYGLVNDVLGCSRDLQSGAQTHLLSTARASLPLSQRDDPVALGKSLIAAPYFEQFLRRAIRAQKRSLVAGDALGMRAMADYTKERIARIEHHIRQSTVLRLAVALAQDKPAQ